MVRWRGRRQSDNVEDRRGQGGGMGGFPFPFPGRGGRMRIPMPGRGGRRGGGGLGIVGILVVLGLMFFFGIDPRTILQGGAPRPGSGPSPQGGQEVSFPKLDIPGMPGTEKARVPGAPSERQLKPATGSQDDLAGYVKVILADTEDVWNRQFQSVGQRYREPKLVLFSGFTQTRCGPGMSAMGPFYCPLDQKVYVDLAFYRQLRDKFGAPGDFAQAYVIAHEVGHHVQTLLGIAEAVQREKSRRGMTSPAANRIQVRMELQADCLAGVWARRADSDKGILERGDIEEGLRAASAIGDDMIQRKTQGHVVPDAFTHGSSEQRVRWFSRGLESGSMRDCDTFNARQL